VSKNVRIRQFGMLITVFLTALFYVCVYGESVFGYSSVVYGDIISRDENSIPGSIIEKIALYPRKMANSHERIMRKAVLIRRKKSKGTVLIAHGFMCTKEDVAFLRSLFPNFNCMTFDMRAHGENKKGQYCTFGRDEAFDVMAAGRFLRNHPDLRKNPLLVYGFSMGAVASIEAQAKDSNLFDGMILDCPFDTTESIIKSGLDNMKLSLFGYEFGIPGRSLLQKYVFHPYVQSFVKTLLRTVAKMDTKSIKSFMYPLYPAESIKKVFAPMLVIHCRNDEKVSVPAVKRVFNNASSKYKKLWLTNGRRHYDSFFYNPEAYARRVGKFANKVVSGQLISRKKKKIIEDIDHRATSVNVSVGYVKEEGGR